MKKSRRSERRAAVKKRNNLEKIFKKSLWKKLEKVKKNNQRVRDEKLRQGLCW